ncbi:MAG: hypothetical protein JSV66_12755 [Trueperaceae bacterium]|nr:MAG: hypothetical protein JSV66_12755 [Trueperaceae bacterium]
MSPALAGSKMVVFRFATWSFVVLKTHFWGRGIFWIVRTLQSIGLGKGEENGIDGVNWKLEWSSDDVFHHSYAPLCPACATTLKWQQFSDETPYPVLVCDHCNYYRHFPEQRDPDEVLQNVAGEMSRRRQEAAAETGAVSL